MAGGSFGEVHLVGVEGVVDAVAVVFVLGPEPDVVFDVVGEVQVDGATCVVGVGARRGGRVGWRVLRIGCRRRCGEVGVGEPEVEEALGESEEGGFSGEQVGGGSVLDAHDGADAYEVGGEFEDFAGEGSADDSGAGPGGVQVGDGGGALPVGLFAEDAAFVEAIWTALW